MTCPCWCPSLWVNMQGSRDLRHLVVDDSLSSDCFDDVRPNGHGNTSSANSRPNGSGKSSLEEVEPIENNIESLSEYRHRWLCLMICCLGTFANYLQSSIYMVSLWPYLSEVDPSISESFFGLLVSALSFGCVVSSTLFGYWSNRIKSTKWPIIAGFTIGIAGNLLMAFIEAFPVPSRRYVMLVARFIVGFGAGNDSVNHAYLAHASTADERSRVMAYQAAFLSGTILIGPGIAAALTPMGYPGLVLGVLHIDMYTMMAFVCILFHVVCIMLYLIPFREYNISIQDEVDDVDGNEDPNSVPVDKVAAVSCIIIAFVVNFCIVYDDSIGSPYSMAMFDWTRNQAVLYNGIIQSVVGVIDLFTNIFVGVIILKFLSERTVIMAGLPLFTLFYVISFSWPGLPLPQYSGLKLHDAGSIDNSFNLTDSITAVANLSASTNLTTMDMAPGCIYDWCAYTPRIHIAQYIVAFFFLAVAYPLVFTATNTLFSKVLGSGRQGVWQGIGMTVVNLAMTISPILVGNLFEYFGPRVAWGAGIGPLMLAIALTVIYWRRLVPTVNTCAGGEHSVVEA